MPSVARSTVVHLPAAVFLILSTTLCLPPSTAAAQDGQAPRIEVITRVEPNLDGFASYARLEDEQPRPVTVEVTIAPDGTISNARPAIPGPPKPLERAMDAARGWRFAPVPGGPVKTYIGFNMVRMTSSGPATVAVPINGIEAPRKIHDSGAVYPEGFTPKPGRQGRLIDVTIDSAGLVVDAVSPDPPDDMTMNAVEAALYWRFEPNLQVPRRKLRMFIDFVSAASFGQPHSKWIIGKDLTGPLVPPRRITEVRPKYPAEAVREQVEGTVVVVALVDKNGRVTAGRIIHSVPLLDKAALDAVKRWKFAPGTAGGKAFALAVTVTVNFTLDR